MMNNRPNIVRRLTAISVAVAFQMTCGGTIAFAQDKGKQDAAAPPRQALLIFPLNSSEIEEQGTFLGQFVAKVLKDGTLRSTVYAGTTFNPKHPIVRRAVDENVLKAADVEGPFGVETDQVARAARIARIMEVPAFIVGEVRSFEMNEEKREATVTVEAELVETVSGRVLDTWVASGKTPETMQAGSQEQFALRASESAAMEIVTKIPGTAPTAVVANTAPQNGEAVKPPANGTDDNNGAAPPVIKKKKNNSGGILAALALVAGIAIAASGGGGGGGGTSIDQPPAPPF